MVLPDSIGFLKECLGKPFNTELIYRASEDGFTAHAFHEKCDNKGANITIIESEHGLKFGAYTSLSWDTSDKWVVDKYNPFIFSLTKRTKHSNFNRQYSICKHPNYLIIFGAGNGRTNDLRIIDRCDNNKTSISSLGCSYDPP